MKHYFIPKNPINETLKVIEVTEYGAKYYFTNCHMSKNDCQLKSYLPGGCLSDDYSEVTMEQGLKLIEECLDENLRQPDDEGTQSDSEQTKSEV
jgi:hypothetical protein